MRIQTIHRFILPWQNRIKGLNWILGRTVKIAENILIRTVRPKSCVNPARRGEGKPSVIVSLTTYPARDKKAAWTIKSLLRQNTEIDRLILWLAREQYPQIPEALNKYTAYGLEIRFCEDLKPHKKYYQTMLAYPEAIVITVDDDVIYPENTVEKLLIAHRKYPDAVVANMARLIRFNGNQFAPYGQWPTNIPEDISQPSFALLPIGEGGVLYPPKSLHEAAFNREAIKAYALRADDLWLKFMAVKANTGVVVSQRKQRGLCEVITWEKSARLNTQNIEGGGNDRVVAELSKLFPEVYEAIANDK